MKAILLKKFGGIENFEFAETAMPAVGYNEVLVKIKATAFNPIDYQMRKGLTESKLLKSSVLGRELSGEIVETGKGVDSFAIGDKVAAYVGSLGSNGTYAEYVSVPATIIAKLPSNITFEQAAAIPLVGLTALQIFNRLAVPKQAPIFIAGGGGAVGTILIKLFLAKGIKNIFTTAGSDESFHQLKSLGLDANNIINYKKTDVIAKAKTVSAGFDYVIDLVGNNMSNVCAELVNVFGTYGDVTFLATKEARELLFDKAATIINIANYAAASKGSGDLTYYSNMLSDLFNKIETRLITPPEINIVGTLSLEAVQKAHLIMENNEARGKKLVMKIV